MIVTGYQYFIEEEAQTARKACADYYGLPKTPDDTTIYWVNYFYAELNEPPFWYIWYDDSILDILGEPSDFELITPEPPIP